VEGWWPAQNKYNELGSHGYMGSWQATRLNIKYAVKGKEQNQLAHTIYGTGIAIERTLACMLENSIGEDGVIRVPKVLSDYTGITEIKPVH
jgi:seryl-tRNA synthetase